MRPLSPHKRFIGPGNMEGMPGVTRHSRAPARETPLEGTKTMLCPQDDHLKSLVTGRATEEAMPSRTADILGYLAMGCAISMLALYWIDRAMHGPDLAWISPGFGLISLALLHLLVIFSQILSSGRNMPGALAIIVLYAGIGLSVIVEHFLA